jgi:hypothetical protein
MLGAAALFGGSALGLEVVSRLYEKAVVPDRLVEGFLSSFEETGEMLGAVLFLVSALAALGAAGRPAAVGLLPVAEPDAERRELAAVG